MLVRSIAALRYKIIITGAYESVEYAIGTIAAAAFAAVLYTVVTGDGIVGALDALVQRALAVEF